jgi:asparagine synthase (glutamine-hydrolysing)
MCGIAGIVNRNPTININIEIQKMLDVIIHRGPDGQGVFVESNLALGHRRLSIIDLSNNAAQPMAYNDKYVMVFNGEIYNFIEISLQLKEKGYLFSTNSDTEVILASYDHWGESCVEHFNGMWSFAIYDKEKQILFCSRDRFGVKPFYYTFHKGNFYFSSEIKQLLSLGIEAIANRKILMDYLILGMEEHKNETFFEGIIKLPASHSLIYNLADHTIKQFSYYTLSPNPEFSNLSEVDAIALFNNELYRSINYRLRSDVKVGTCLSGGLDSSYIASLASLEYSKRTNKQFTAITAQSSDKSNDETHYAKIIVDKYALDWHVIEPTTDNFKSQLTQIIKGQEEPFGSPSIFMQYHVMQTSKEIGCTVLLDGQGGDESLLGYERYFAPYIQSLPFIKWPKAIINSSSNSRIGVIKTIKYLIYFGNSRIRKNHIKKKMNFLNKKAFDCADFSLINEISKAGKDIHKLQLLELTKTQLPHLLRYEDRNSMMNSIETRLPYLDYKLVELMISLPTQLKIHNGWTKYILRKSSDGVLPESIAWRKNKFGFEAPENIWLKDKTNIINEIKKSVILKEYITKEIPLIDNRILWRLLNIAIWEKCYNVK